MDELLNTAPCGFLTFTDNGDIALANETLARMLEYADGELVGLPVDRILPVASRIFYQTHFFPLLKLHGKVEEVYMTFRSKDGRDLPMLVNAVRREHDGNPVNDCILVHMKERSEYEDEILRAKKAAEEAISSKDQFLATVSHELRTPLNSILGWTRMLTAGRLDKEKADHALKAVERGALSLNQLIEDLLDFSRIISGRLRLNLERVELASVVEAALDVVRPAAIAKNISLHSLLSTDAGPVSGDPDRLQQVLWNLLSNAVKFTPKGGRVLVSLSRANSSVEVAVSDSGQGISSEFLPYVFDRFRQADSTAARKGGLGLGMSITRHLVELHGGTIRAESPGEGLGATFTVQLPVMTVLHSTLLEYDNAQFYGNDREGGEQPGLDGLRVLIVEDDADARRMLTTVLEHSGADVASSPNAVDGFEAIRRLKPDVLISDIELPDGDGYSLIGRVRRSDDEAISRTPAVALSAHAKETDRVRALEAGFQLHITKPVEPIELVRAIASLTNKKGNPAGQGL